MLRVSAHAQEGGDGGRGAQRRGGYYGCGPSRSMIDYQILSVRKRGSPLPPPVSQDICMSHTRKDKMNLGILPLHARCEFSWQWRCCGRQQRVAEGLGTEVLAQQCSGLSTSAPRQEE